MRPMAAIPMARILCKRTILAVWIAVSVLSSSCSSEEEFAELVYFEDRWQAEPVDWSGLFSGERTIALQPPDEDPGAFQIAKVLVDSNGNLVVPDSKKRRVLFFASSGEFVRAVGKEGEGPGEFGFLRTLALDSQDNLYVFDLNEHRLHVFEAPDYRFSQSFGLSTYLSAFFLDPAGGIIAYYPTAKDVLKKFDPQGNLVAKAFRPEREDIAIFLSRIQTGGIIGTPLGEVLLIHPDSFVIYHYDGNLKGKRILRSESHSKWRPRMPDFPESLSPRTEGPEHKEWWDSHLHIGGIYWLGNDLLAVTLYSIKGGDPRIWYLNLYTMQGRAIAEGVAIPQQGRVVGSSEDLIYVATQPALDQDGSVRPSSLREYRLRKIVMRP